MIYGIGTDIVEIARVQQVLARHPDMFARRTYTEAERAIGATLKSPEQFYAGRWAAKEAVAKALGVGFGKECNWLDIEILNTASGRPAVTLSGSAAAFAERQTITTIYVSISHEKHYAVAMAVADTEQR